MCHTMSIFILTPSSPPVLWKQGREEGKDRGEKGGKHQVNEHERMEVYLTMTPHRDLTFWEAVLGIECACRAHVTCRAPRVLGPLRPGLP